MPTAWLPCPGKINALMSIPYRFDVLLKPQVSGNGLACKYLGSKYGIESKPALAIIAHIRHRRRFRVIRLDSNPAWTTRGQEESRRGVSAWCGVSDRYHEGNTACQCMSMSSSRVRI